MRNPLDVVSDYIFDFFFLLGTYKKSTEERGVIKNKPMYSSTREWLRFIVTVAFLFVLIKTFLIQPFLVQQESMVPTFHPFDYIVVDRFTYTFIHEPKRGDVVVFKSGPENGNKYLIKRVVGLPNEEITVDGTTTRIVNSENPQGITLNESYVVNLDERTKKTMKLSDSEYFMLGDNRPLSLDSRQLGPIQRDQIVGRTLFRLYPLSKISLFPGSVDVSVKKP